MTAIRFVGRINTALILTVVYFIILPLFYLPMVIAERRAKTKSQWLAKEQEQLNSHEFPF